MSVKQIGHHRVQHGDLLNGIDRLMGDVKADVFYADPPWGAGHLKFFQDMNYKMTGTPKKVTDQNEFTTAFFKTAMDYAKNWVVVEYGLRWAGEIVETGKSFGLHHRETVLVYYRKNKPMNVHIFSKNLDPLPAGYIEALTEQEGINSIRTTLGYLAKPGDVIMDPVCGLGLTAKVCIEQDLIFYGNELNAKRLDKTIERLERSVK